MAPLQQPTTSLVGVSDMHMNLKQEVFYNSIRMQEGQAQKQFHLHKKYKHDSTKVNKQRKTMSRDFTNQNVPYMI